MAKVSSVFYLHDTVAWRFCVMCLWTCCA